MIVLSHCTETTEILAAVFSDKDCENEQDEEDEINKNFYSFNKVGGSLKCT